MSVNISNDPIKKELFYLGEKIGRYELYSNNVKLYTYDERCIIDRDDDYFGSYYSKAKREKLEGYLISFLIYNSI